jgi:hypothetical protein
VLAEIRCYLVVLLGDLLLGGVGEHGAKGGATISFWDPRSGNSWARNVSDSAVSMGGPSTWRWGRCRTRRRRTPRHKGHRRGL